MHTTETNGNAAITTAAISSHNNLFSEGDLLFWKSEYAKAREHFQKAVNGPSLTLLELARCYKSLGASNTKLQNYEEAISNYYSHLDVLMKLELSNRNEDDIARSYMSLGMVYYLQLDYERALAFHQQALEALPIRNSFPDLTSNIYKNLASLYTKTKEFDMALVYFEKALEIDRCHLREDHLKFGQTYADIAAMYYSKQDYQRALNYCAQARETWLKSLPPSSMYIESMEKTIREIESKWGKHSPRRTRSRHRTHTENEPYNSLEYTPHPHSSL